MDMGIGRITGACLVYLASQIVPSPTVVALCLDW
jgi:hypothetical protein